MTGGIFISDDPLLFFVQIFQSHFMVTSPIEPRSRLAIEKAIYEVIVPDPSTPLPPFVSISFRFVMVLTKTLLPNKFKPDSDLS